MNVEVEIKAKLDRRKLSNIQKRLEKEGSLFISDVMEEDLYFNSPSVDFMESDEALRIRKKQAIEGNNGNTGEITYALTYKGPKMHKDSKTRREVNIGIKPEDANEMRELLLSLGFGESGIVVKRRKKFLYKDFKICLDSVRGLDEFIEIERIVDTFDHVDEIVEEMKTLFPELEGAEWIRTSYLEMCQQGETIWA